KTKHSTGIMNKMRDRMPLIIIILIIAFLGTIIFEWGMNYLGLRGSQQVVFGKVNGVEIQYKEYEALLQKQGAQMKEQNKGKELDEQAYQQVREQVWNYMVQQTLKEQEMKRLGVTVTDQEVLNWVYNEPETLPDWLKNNFNDSLGVFHSEYLQGAIQAPENKEKWVEIEQYLIKTLQDNKLNSLIASSVSVSEGDVLQKYKDDNIKAGFSYLLLDPNMVMDTNVFQVSDEEMKKYYDEHKDDFKQEDAVRFKYLVFPDMATADDSTNVRKLLEGYIKQLKTSTIEDSSLIKIINDESATPFNAEFQKPNALGKGVISFLFNASKDSVSNLIIDQDAFKIVKLLDTKEGEDTYANASHLLVNFGTDTAAAKKKAEDILTRIKKGEDFDKLAFELSEDPSAKQNSGDLGWFTKGSMVKEFEDAALNGKIGDIVGPVKTQFGFHLIKIKGKSKKEFKFAELKKPVVASSRTKDIARKKASDFIKELEKGQGSFLSCNAGKKLIIDTLARTMNMNCILTPEISKGGFVPGSGQNANVIKFGLESSIDKVFGPVKVQGGYSVYQVSQKISEGYKNFDSIKVSMIKPKLQQKKKFEVMMQTANELKNKIQNNDLNSLKSIYPQYAVESVDTLSMAKPDQKVGMDYKLLNEIFKLKAGEVSVPIKGDRGYFIVKINWITPYNEADYLAKQQDIRKQLMMSKQQSAVQEWMQNLQSSADIEDNRDRLLN
ncbi:MAG: peptidylprolyl isomerase, partial [Ignavibacteriae bacterium]|nr:peptidylprolyl isomerase [Ignavibacteriota bacterium]